MDKAQAIHAFWNSFGWDAIDEQSSYDDRTIEELNIQYPYITYEVATGNLGDPLQLTASLWDRSTSFEALSKKADEIAAAIGYGGKIIKIDGGYLWIKLANPFAQRMPDEDKYDLRRIVLNISVDFLTAT